MTACLCLSSVLLAAPIQATPATARAHWPQFRGPDRTNHSTDTGLLRQWPDGGPPLLWTAADCGVGFSTVAVAGGAIYTTGGVNDVEYVIALDMDGRAKWRSPNGPYYKPARSRGFARTFGGARATPTVDGDAVYCLSSLGRLAAFNAADGKERWALDVCKAFGAKAPNWGFAESVLIDGDTLICYPGGPKGYMVALDKGTGKVVWANTEIGEAAAYCSAILVESGGRRQAVTISADSVLGVEAATGKLLWRHPFTNSRKNNVPSPLHHNGSIVVSTGYGARTAMLRLKEGGTAVKEVWSVKKPDNHHGGVVLVDGHVYATGHRAKGLYCLRLKDGEVVHQTRGKGSLTVADGMLYFLDERGKMQLVQPAGGASAGHKTVSEFQAPSGGEGRHWAYPVVCGGRLYIRHADKLFCYDVRAK